MATGESREGIGGSGKRIGVLRRNSRARGRNWESEKRIGVRVGNMGLKKKKGIGKPDEGFGGSGRAIRGNRGDDWAG